jgi:ABC-2 type transport system ATP-binding protein
VRGLIRELGGDHTIILSTHILSEAEQICDRVLIINRGEIVAADALERLAERSSHGDEDLKVTIGAAVDDNAVAAWLATVHGVSHVLTIGSGEYRVTTHRERETRALIASGAVANGWDVYELTPIVVTLEDIFLQVTANEPHAIGELEGEPADELEELDDLDAVADAGSPDDEDDPDMTEDAEGDGDE